jgi:DNA-directed RNA polymerase subunit H
MVKKVDIAKHQFVPKHEKVSEKEKKELFGKFHISGKNLPRILVKDSAIEHLNVKEGDVVKITRFSMTAGKTVFYRVVSNV